MKKTKLWLPDKIHHKMIEEANNWAPFETGGTFMGYIAENEDIVITDMIDAGKNAIRKYCSFEPDQNYQLKEIGRIYKASGKNKVYLGDWHTHPGSSTDLSNKDKKTLIRIGTSTESQIPRPIMVILGSKPSEWSINSVQFISGKLLLWTFATCDYEVLENIIWN